MHFPRQMYCSQGWPYTAFQIPLESILQVKLKKPQKHHARSRSAKRNSAASSSTGGGFLSPPGSTTISPALSRIQSRNTPRSRSVNRNESHLNPVPRHQGRDASPAPGAADARRGRSPAVHRDESQLPPPTEQPLDFGALINRKEDPYVVVVYSEMSNNAAKVEFRFESGLYVDEAKDLVARLREYPHAKKNVK